MGQYDELDPGHGEPGHVHDERWNRRMMETDDGTTVRETDVTRTTADGSTYADRTTVVEGNGTAAENQEGGKEAVGAGVGALGGAGIGMAVGGPVGAVVGGAIGAVGGAVAGESTEGNDEAGAGAGGLAGGLGGAAVGGAIAGPPGAVVGGAIGAAGGAGAGDKAEEDATDSEPLDRVATPR